jgi:elongation factor P
MGILKSQLVDSNIKFGLPKKFFNFAMFLKNSNNHLWQVHQIFETDFVSPIMVIYTQIVEVSTCKTRQRQCFRQNKTQKSYHRQSSGKHFPAGHKIDDVRVERRKFQYLYNDESGYNFMDNETYDQVSLNEAMLERPDFLKEGSEIEILFHAEKNIPLTAEMPSKYYILEITYTEPGVRGDTATNVTKPATVETGAEVKVPIFINQGDRIKIDTKTGAYLERVKA